MSKHSSCPTGSYTGSRKRKMGNECCNGDHNSNNRSNPCPGSSADSRPCARSVQLNPNPNPFNPNNEQFFPAPLPWSHGPYPTFRQYQQPQLDPMSNHHCVSPYYSQPMQNYYLTWPQQHGAFPEQQPPSKKRVTFHCCANCGLKDDDKDEITEVERKKIKVETITIDDSDESVDGTQEPENHPTTKPQPIIKPIKPRRRISNKKSKKASTSESGESSTN